MTVKFDDNGWLACPHCGGGNLRHVFCEAYWRTEDAEAGIVAMSDLSGVSVHTEQARNPSGRRDGVRIDFTCETCPGESSLTIVQHKGSTLIEWESPTE